MEHDGRTRCLSNLLPPSRIPHRLPPPPPPVTFSAVTPTAAAIAAKIKEAAKTKERCGYLTKQIVVSSWGLRILKFPAQEGKSIPPFYRAVLSFPGPHAPFISRQFNVIRGSLVSLSFPVLSCLRCWRKVARVSRDMHLAIL